MKGNRGPALAIWSRVLYQLVQDMKKYEKSADSLTIEKKKAEHEQDIFRQILPGMITRGEIEVLNLNRCLYSSGLWYEHRKHHVSMCGRTVPIVLNNNFVNGVARKVKRAMAYGHWFLKGDGSAEKSQQCVQNWKATMMKVHLTFT